MLNSAAVLPARITTPLLTLATAGLLLVSCRVWSWVAGDATVTVPNEPCWLTVVVGLNVSDAGGCCGLTVIGDATLTPFQLAVTVAVVSAVTLLVGTVAEPEKLPAGIVNVGGGFTAAWSLVRLTTAPPEGA